MTEDWATVATAINQRLTELGWRQRELAQRSHVSLAIVRELQHNTVQRRRGPRTLESLSVALGWHPQHLNAVLHSRTPPSADETAAAADDSLWSRLDSLEHRLDEITDRLDDLRSGLATVLEHIKSDR
ncbi:MAG TPA: XRE family transcriptional regulator [Pseudonocardiaceae bacterium]|nr:XRE family transcriptional regulator [Pseudonocardiaceae bacterium]